MSDKITPRALDSEGVPDGDYVLAVAGGHVTGLAEAGAGGTGVVETVVAGTGIAVDSTDPANPVVSATGAGGSTDPEVVRDTMAAALVAGTGITITPDDAADTITIAATGGGGGSSSTVKDRLWTPSPASTSIDEFNDSSLDAAWTRVDPSASASRVTWTEDADVLAAVNSGGDPGGLMHGLVRANSLSVGQRLQGHLRMLTTGANYHMAGLVVADGNVAGAGSQVMAAMWWDGSVGLRVNLRQNTGYTAGGPDGTAISPWAGPNMPSTYLYGLHLALLRASASTWELRGSLDGVGWIRMAQITNSLVPTHVGVFCSTWGATQPFNATLEYLRVV